MLITWSFFPSIRDIIPTYETLSWPDACDRLHAWSLIARPPSAKDAGTVPTISPAEFRPGATRRKDAVARWSFAAFDLDNDDPARSVRFEDVVELLGDLPYILHSTTKSKPDHHRMRLILPLSRPVEINEFDAFWWAANERFGRLFDHRTRDPSRVFFIPAAWDGAENRFACRVEGAALDVDALIAAFPVPAAPTVAPASVADTVWRLAPPCDDPTALVTEEMQQEYFSAPIGSGRFYKFMCRIAARARFLGVSITAADLEALALMMDGASGKARPRTGTRREAEHALNFIARQPAPEPFRRDPRLLDRIRRRQARAMGGAA